MDHATIRYYEENAEALFARYQGPGRNFQMYRGLDRFVVDSQDRRLDSAATATLRELCARLASTILEGPVAYSGGALVTGRLFFLRQRHQAHNPGGRNLAGNGASAIDCWQLDRNSRA